jgi:hypothetical protein
MPTKTSSAASAKTPKTTKKTSAKSIAKSGKASMHAKDKTVRVMTLNERLADMRAHGAQMRKTKASALAFLKRAGIVDDSDELAQPFRN